VAPAIRVAASPGLASPPRASPRDGLTHRSACQEWFRAGGAVRLECRDLQPRAAPNIPSCALLIARFRQVKRARAKPPPRGLSSRSPPLPERRRTLAPEVAGVRRRARRFFPRLHEVWSVTARTIARRAAVCCCPATIAGVR